MVAAGDPIYASDINNLAARVFVTGIGITASSSAIGNTETVVLTVPSYTYKANSVYAMLLHGNITGGGGTPPANNNGATALFRFRKTNASGQQFDTARVVLVNTSSTGAHYECLFQVGSSDVTAALAVTLQGGAAFTATLSASGTSPSACDVYRIGAEGGAPTALTAYAPILV